MKHTSISAAILVLASSGCSLLIDNGPGLEETKPQSSECGECPAPKICNKNTAQCECDFNSRPQPTLWSNWHAISEPIPDNTYLIQDSDVVLDGQTCLLWKRDPQHNKNGIFYYTWDEATNACPPGWRLPTIVELRSIIDYSRYSPSLNSSAFHICSGSPKGGWFWSSTTSRDSSNIAWYANFEEGYSSAHTKTENGLVRCVK